MKIFPFLIFSARLVFTVKVMASDTIPDLCSHETVPSVMVYISNTYVVPAIARH